MDTALVWAAAGLIFAGVVKGAIGFGLPMIAVPFLATFLEPRTAVVVMSLVNFVSASLVVFRMGLGPLRRYRGVVVPMTLMSFIGVVLAAQFLASMSSAALSALVGGVAIAFALLSLAKVQPEVPPERQSLVGAFIGLGAGLLGGTTSVFATPVVMYFHALSVPKRDFVTLLNTVLASTMLVQITSYAALGLYNQVVLASAGITIVCVGIGIGIGLIIQNRVNQIVFNRIVIGVIFAVGLHLLVGALRAIAGQALDGREAGL